MDDESRITVGVGVNLDNGAFVVKAEYIPSKVADLLLSVLSYAREKGPTGFRQNSKLVKRDSLYPRWDTNLVLGPNEQGAFDEALAWYKNRVLTHGDNTKERNPGLMERADSFIRWALPYVLHSIALPVLNASLIDASGERELSLSTLVTGIKRTLDEEFDGLCETPPSPVLTFDFTIQDDYGGELRCAYNYVPMITQLIQETKTDVSLEFEQSVVSAIDENALTGNAAEQLRARLYTLHARIIQTYALIAPRLFMDGLADKLKAALTERITETAYEVGRELKGQLFKDEKGHSVSINRDLSTRLQNALNYAEKRTKVRLQAPGPGGSDADYDLNQLKRFYYECLPKWQDAKRIYKDNRQRNWQAIVKGEHSDLPDQLIKRLSDPPNLPESELAILAVKGGISKASDIALEHAARLCGVPAYHYTLAHLERIKRKQA